YENLNVRRYVIDAATHWAKLGVDGFRCDVAWGVPHDFWRRLRRSLKTVNPDFLLINEVLPRSPDYHKDEFDMSYDTDFYGNLLDVMNGRKPLAAIDYGLKKTQKNYPSVALDFRYLENHDMDRFISQFGMRKTKLAAALLLTIPGTPLIYYGQETGLREKTPLMDWQNQNDSLFAFYKTVIRLRRQHTALRRGEMIKVPTDAEDRVYAYIRKDSKETFLIILNFSKHVEECQLLFPKEKFDAVRYDRLILEESVTSEKITIDITNELRLKLRLEPESPYIYRFIR
ncbi:MAG TPA: alpha-amylase family glycosyl hydrolase, partial [bacterium]